MRVLTSLLIVCGGCDDSFEPAPDDDDTEAVVGCPDGLSQAADASLIMTQFEVNGAALSANFNPAFTYAGVPAACTNNDASAFQLIFEVGGLSYGRIELTHNGPGTYDANAVGGDSGASLSIAIFGSDVPATYEAGDWQTSSWSVDEEGFAVTSSFFGSGFDGDQRLSLNFQAAVTP